MMMSSRHAWASSLFQGLLEGWRRGVREGSPRHNSSIFGQDGQEGQNFVVGLRAIFPPLDLPPPLP